MEHRQSAKHESDSSAGTPSTSNNTDSSSTKKRASESVASSSTKKEGAVEEHATDANNTTDGHDSSTNIAMSPTIKNNVGKYKLVRTIGKGNFAKVKLAIHMATGIEVVDLLSFISLRLPLKSSQRRVSIGPLMTE